ncbi:UPF0182 family protein [Microbacterium amylolyticum]|uniref:UPF0182 protein JOF34_002370 n=1 Tax=Microbacterium amylolyticum TaxID=936337 RepID=A0ABS4ZKG9_9MICO|nr:UPF0182 family protein [Microbacterium amylolyticum]MBP2437784.1 uncharacterized membrane protein (UPF0182 family) [Microbacterium amylolyticum]
MTTNSTQKPATSPSPIRRVVVVTVVVIAALLVAFFGLASLYTDFLWFDQLGFASVLTTQWVARGVMFAIGFVGMAVPVWLAIFLAYRLRPVYARLSSQLDRYQEVVEPLRRLGMWAVPVLFGFFAGFAASAQWQTTWLWMNAVNSGQTDPQFGLDTSFYMFELPFWQGIVGFASAVVILSLLVTGLVSYLYGSLRVGQGELSISKPARIQIAILAGVYLLLRGVSIWLDRFASLVAPTGRITGPDYVVDNALIPGQTILAVVAALVAILFLVTAFVGRWRYPLVATGLLIATSLVVTMALPWGIQTFQVTPNERALQLSYFQHNVDATRAAYALDQIETIEYTAETEAEAGQLRDDAATTASLRLMDPAIISPTVRQLQQYRPYYGFSETLNVDRYEIDGEIQDTVVAVRELNLNELGASAQSWVNTTMTYTHGYGLVAAKGNERTNEGEPVFIEGDIPSQGFLTDREYEPRIYFGENSPPYSIVGGPEGGDDVELAYATGSGEQNQVLTTFDGDGGPSIGSYFHRLLYALKFQSEQIIFSDQINSESQVLYDRNPRERVQKVAPYLTLDNNPYPSVVDGRVVWIVDGYTTSATYPYSSQVSLSEAISDSANPQPNLLIDDVNYIRNSVKATVDAYDGSVTLYAWDEEDPVLQTWQNVFPTTIEPISEMSGDLMSHVRYPTDLFKVQRAMLGVYHVDSANAFYQRDNAWETPADPSNQTMLQPPYYLTMQMPGQDEPTFSMFSTFIPEGGERQVLMGYLGVDSDAGNESGEVREGYGTLRMLQISSASTVPAPGQVQNAFNSDSAIAQDLNVLRIGDSEVSMGNLLTLPVGGGLLYMQPVYVQSSSGTSYPLLRKVLVSFGDQLAFEDTLADALDALFDGDSGAETGDDDIDPVAIEDIIADGGQPGTDPDAGSVDTGDSDDTTAPAPAPDAGSVADLLAQAQTEMDNKANALSEGDMVAYAQADARLMDIVEALLALED